MIIRPARPDDPEIAPLVGELAAYHRSLHPGTSNHLRHPQDRSPDAFYFVGAFEGSRVVGIGGFKRAKGHAEISSVFVSEAHRGSGAALELMGHLEERAREEGFPIVRLETGTRQPRAVAFYRKLGYRETEPFEPYEADPLSVFMAKDLVEPETSA
jgi:putative acetyltransferase